jgi:cytoskeleton protein RodZ
MSERAAIAPAAEPGPGGAGPGARLRTARELRGIALGAVAESLHVAPRLVAAMEGNDFAAFDAPVYAKGFLRKYAAVLGVPADEVLAAYEALAAGPSQPSLIPAMTVAAPKPAMSKLPPAPALVVAALVVAAAAVGAAWWWSTRPRSAPAAAESLPPTVPEAAPAAGPTAAPQHPARAEQVAVVMTPSAAARARQADAAPVLARPAAAAAATTAAERHGSRGAAAREDVLVIHALAECWTEVYAPNGARLIYDLVHSGESRDVPGPGPWRVVLGAVDGARLTVGERAVVVPPPRRGATTAIFVVARDGAAH